MAFASSLTYTFAFLSAFQLVWGNTLAQNDTEKLPTFGDVVQVLGAVSEYTQDFHILTPSDGTNRPRL